MTTLTPSRSVCEVVDRDVGVEEHLVAEAGATARADGDAQHEIVGSRPRRSMRLMTFAAAASVRVKTWLASVTVNIDMVTSS